MPSTPETSDESAVAEPTGLGAAPDEQGAPERPAPPAGRRSLLTLLVALTVVVLVVDQLTKAWALTSLDGTRRVVLGDWLGLQLVFNPGAALSIATGMTWVLTLVAIGVVVVVARVSRRLGSTLWAVALGLLLGGALGNLMDRLFRQPGFARGHVIDFIAYADWFVGNVADIAIVVAAGLIVIAVARGVQVDGTRERDDEHAAGQLDEQADEQLDEPADEATSRGTRRTDSSDA